MRSLLLFFVALAFCSCIKDKPSPSQIGEVNLSDGKKIYILNEGNFGSGNASLSMYDSGTDEVIDDIFKTQNQSNLGDVAQSFTKINEHFYLVMNNSNKIVVCDNQLKKSGEIAGLNSPRYILKVSNKKAYVSDLYANGIHIVDINSNTKTAAISCSGWTEQMVMIYNKVFVTNISRNYLYVINAVTDKIEDSVFVGPSAGSIVIDKNDRLWVLSGGEVKNNLKPCLSQIDPITYKIENKIVLDETYASNLVINAAGDVCYFLGKGIKRLRISENSSEVFVAGNGQYYGLAVDPVNNDVYLSDAIDYSQKSQITVYNSSGTLVKSFKAGIMSNSFYFD